MCAKTKKEKTATKAPRKRSAKIISQKFIDLMETGISKKGRKTKKLSKDRLNLINSQEFQQRVEKKAYELFEQRGCNNGNDQGDWLEAERIVTKELSN